MKDNPIRVSADQLEEIAWNHCVTIEFSATHAHLIHEGHEYVAPLPSAVA